MCITYAKTSMCSIHKDSRRIPGACHPQWNLMKMHAACGRHKMSGVFVYKKSTPLMGEASAAACASIHRSAATLAKTGIKQVAKTSEKHKSSPCDVTCLQIWHAKANPELKQEHNFPLNFEGLSVPLREQWSTTENCWMGKVTFSANYTAPTDTTNLSVSWHLLI